MEGQGCLGIYLTRDKAIAVCLDSEQASAQVTACFEVSLQEDQTSAQFTQLSDEIAQLCHQRDLQFSHVAVALDCSLYMQHDVHSSFADERQIESTVRFDTEEALATDISDDAIAFSILSSDESGSVLSVFTSQKNLLSDLINALAANNLDPASVEPDVACLCRFMTNRYFDGQKLPNGALFAAMSETNGYLIGPLREHSEAALIQRTFLISPDQDRNNILLRQVPLSIASLSANASVNRLLALDSTGSLQIDSVASSLKTATQPVKFPLPQDCTNSVAFAAACGAAMSYMQQEPHISFRSDYMPYLGKRRRLEKTLKIISVSACIILVAVGLNLSLTLMQKNKPVKLLRARFAADYADALPEKQKMPARLTTARNDLKRALDRIKRVKSGQATDEESVSARLTLILQAFNAVASNTDLNIDKITITGKNIIVTGDTSNRSNTLKLLAQIKKMMDVQQENVGNKGGRDTFSITAVPKTGG